ncbi:MAG: TIM-barrel domain-containing protein [Clostridiaceae bacterium]
MPLYQHQFSPIEETPFSSLYRADGMDARVEFLTARLIRVSVVPAGARLLSTYSVQPGESLPHEGRARLSLEGFALFTPLRESAFSFVWDAFRLTIDPVNFLLALEQDGAPLLTDRAPLAVNLGGEFGRGQKHYLVREPGERIYGLGDKSGSLNKSGRRFRLDSTDAMGYDAETSDPLYKHVPFAICQNNAGCVGLYYNTHEACSFDFGAEISNYTGTYRYFSSEDESLVYYILLGSLPEIVTGFSALTGGSAFLPRRALLYWGSTMAYTDAPDADMQLRRFADTCGQKAFACGGFYLSSGYTSIGNKRCVFHWNNQKIPDPKALAAYFAARGMDLIANIKPVFLTDHPLYKTIASRGWFLQNPDGTPALAPFWDGLGSFLDFTNPGAFDFWKAQVKTQLLENGIAFTWNDNNEYEVLDERVLANCFGRPAPAHRMKPVFSMLMTMASLEAQTEFFGKSKRQLVSTRAGCAGLCRMALTWTGDNRTEWKTLRYNHFMGLTMSLSGLYLFGHDIGGFAGSAPERELFLRWLQHGALTPRFVVHSWNDDNQATTPWFYPDAEDAARRIFAFRQRILPYLYNAAYRAHAFCEPILRPLVYYDPAADPESDLFFVGADLLAVCVFDPGKTAVLATLPQNPGGWFQSDGGWFQSDGGWFPGGTSVLLDCPLEGEPTVLFRGGGMMAADVSSYPSSGKERLCFTVYAQETGETEREFFTDDGASEAYLQNDCLKVRFRMRFLPNEVCVAYQNLGNQAIQPQVALCDRLNRTLRLEEERI